jgi:hypothetical protein
MRVDLKLLTDEELIRSIKVLVGEERRTVVAILRHLNEFDRRTLAARSSFPSLFEYCVKELRYAQGEAARRIHVARAAAKFPVLYGAIERGLISLTVASMLAPHLKWDNYRKVIRSSLGKSTREVEALVASLLPCASAPAERVRFLVVAAVKQPEAVEDLFAPLADIPAATETPAVAEENDAAAVPPEAAVVERGEASGVGGEASGARAAASGSELVSAASIFPSPPTNHCCETWSGRRNYRGISGRAEGTRMCSRAR